MTGAGAGRRGRAPGARGKRQPLPYRALEHGTGGGPMSYRAARGGAAQRVENECTVVDRYVCPGRSTVDGNDGWLGESGKCWVSRAKASPCR